jgi:YidC/Oxa1 family membrane protein insertase
MFAASAFDPFFTAFASVLAFFYSLTGNYALAIIMLTLVVMIVVTPLTLKGTKSMMVMQQLQPEIRRIQSRYKDDRQKLNEELLKFYKENSINPLGGCLPLLVQMPVFIVLYQVLHGLTRRVSDLGAAVGWASGQFPSGNVTAPPGIERVFDPAWIDTSTDMYQDLSSSTSMNAFGLDLSESASDALSQGVVHALPYLVLIAIVAVTGFVQQRQIQGRNPNATVNPQQQMIMKIMPFFLPVISFGLPAGLVLYFAVSNLYRIGQQAFISRSIYGIHRDERGTGVWMMQLLGFGPRQAGGGSKSSAKKSSGQAKQGSKPAAKAKAKPSRDQASSKGGASQKQQKQKQQPATRGSAAAKKSGAQSSRRTSDRTSTDSSDESAGGRGKGGREPAPPAETRSPGSSGGNGGGSTLQPRARRKKR